MTRKPTETDYRIGYEVYRAAYEGKVVECQRLQKALAIVAASVDKASLKGYSDDQLNEC